ncbi:MAG: Sua5/YciO/YrdC/YwlC family protein, partial [Coriobacteriales bacterium]|nr:Sua5/YciO/YrdC/YwlC family protein [Coriobacteriales bacterium]
MVTRRIRAYGIVQGVGFRPTVSRHATAAQITGTVCNKGPYVEIFAQGTEAQVEAFVDALRTQPPRRAAILKLDIKDVAEAEAPAYASFEIVESEHTSGEIFVSPDIAICDDCVRELYDPRDRRYLHPFINCTCCGPRLTILDALPYDRVRTSMSAFPMCERCASEYYSPATRRYDAQPVCCNDCGPQVYMLDRPERGGAAITEARRIVAAGGVVAVKGIGGFHLCCDATNPAAVDLLRERKRRSAKPFAVMAASLEVVERECEVPDEGPARELLCGHQKPILLLPKRADGQVCEAVAPHNPKLGIMLPYAPLQLLLFNYPDGVDMPDCLVMTSANESGAPICRDDEDARRELGPLSDAILSHDRLIRVRADDTVMDLFEGEPYLVRRSRGWAPLPAVLSQALAAPVLAVGGELKNTFCLGTGELLYPSSY